MLSLVQVVAVLQTDSKHPFAAGTHSSHTYSRSQHSEPRRLVVDMSPLRVRTPQLALVIIAFVAVDIAFLFVAVHDLGD